ncbi:MAG: SDR family oxidoreductase [Burkholderiales bacterium]|nr:SDR family oxidoreductase [Burkholderiales bacterium]
MPRPAPLRVVVSGASSGIGAALARRYAGEGATVGLIARRRDALERLAGELPGPSAVYAIDVRDADATRAAARHFTGRHGCPDLVIASAGVSAGTLTEEPGDIAVFDEVLGVNVLGMVRTFQPFVDCMRAAGRGRLAGIASVAGYRGLPGAAAYSASKAAVIAYLESLRVELRGTGITVSTICPGYVATPMTEGNPYPMPFMLSADEAARRIARVIARGRSFAVIPWQMAIVARVLRAMPDRLYDRLLAGAPRKPRRS